MSIPHKTNLRAEFRIDYHCKDCGASVPDTYPDAHTRRKIFSEQTRVEYDEFVAYCHEMYVAFETARKCCSECLKKRGFQPANDYALCVTIKPSYDFVSSDATPHENTA